MKKTLITIALLLIAVPVSALTLYEYYGGNLPTIAERIPVYHQYFDGDYSGTAEQNTNLVNALIGNQVVDNGNSLLLGATLPQGVAVFQTSLLSAITSSASSMNIVANSVRGGSTLSGYNCFTVDEGSSIAEYICGTVSGTSITSLLRGVDPVTGTTTNATLQFAHRRGAEVKITDFPLIQIMKHQLNGEDTLPNSISYDGAKTPVIGRYNIPSWDYVKNYADGLAIAGSPNADTSTKGIIEIGTAIENASTTSTGSTGATLVISSAQSTSTPLRGCDGTATAGALCAVVAQNNGKINQGFIDLTQNTAWSGTNTHAGLETFTATSTFATTTFNGANFGNNTVNSFTGGETISGAATPKAVMLATTTALVSMIKSDVASTSAPLLGFVINNCALNTTCYVQTDGIVKGFSGLTAGLEYYVSDTAGTISTTVGTSENYVGRAVSTSAIQIERRADQYLGTQVLSEGANAIGSGLWYWWRKVIINAGCDAVIGQGTIYRKGLPTSFTVESANGSAPSFQSGVSVSFSGNTITLADTGNACSSSGNAYFYK